MIFIASTTVLTAPSPPTTGATIHIQVADVSLFPTAPFEASIWPSGRSPLDDDVEIVHVTAMVGTTLTCVRSCEFAQTRAVLVGDNFAVTVTSYTITRINAFTGMGPFRPPAGTSSNPIYSFEGDTFTGLYYLSSGVMVYTSHGTPALRMSAGAMIMDWHTELRWAPDGNLPGAGSNTDIGMARTSNASIKVTGGDIRPSTGTLGGTLFDHFADVGNTTTGGADDDLYTDTTAAKQFGANGDKIKAAYGGVFVSSGTATRKIKLWFAGTAVFDTGALTLSLSSAWTVAATLIRVSATVVRYAVTLVTEGAALPGYTAVGELTGLTLTATNILKITAAANGVGAAANDIVAKLGTVEFYPAA